MGRNAEQNRLLREAQYAAILACALDLFVSRGFAATRVADIAGAAGISPGLLYHYFPGKDDILVALLQNALPKLEAAAHELEALSAPAADKIRAALRLSIQGMVENSENGKYHLLLVQLAASDVLPEAARALIDAHAQTPYCTMQRIFALVWPHDKVAGLVSITEYPPEVCRPWAHGESIPPKIVRAAIAAHILQWMFEN